MFDPITGVAVSSASTAPVAVESKPQTVVAKAADTSSASRTVVVKRYKLKLSGNALQNAINTGAVIEVVEA